MTDKLYAGALCNVHELHNYYIHYLCYFRYPFDTQKCPLKVQVPRNYYNQFVLKWGEPPIIQDIKMNKYDVLKHLEYENDTLSKIIRGVEITLCRKISYHIVNIYIPSFVLMMIAGLTLFIDFSHFEVTIMIALTSMLVLYTLYQSISAYLPQTSYMKMIDIWLFGGLIFPFIIITILVIMDSLISREKNQGIDMKLHCNSLNFFISFFISWHEMSNENDCFRFARQEC